MSSVLAQLRTALLSAWSVETAKQWTTDKPTAGQCNVTAVIIQELAGGDIVKTNIAGRAHFYNLINGQRHDLTAEQFDGPINYDDLPSSRDEALMGVTAKEYDAMAAAIDRQLQTNDKFS